MGLDPTDTVHEDNPFKNPVGNYIRDTIKCIRLTMLYVIIILNCYLI